MAPWRGLDDLQVAGRRVLVRVDLNLPMRDGAVTDATRIDRVLPTVRELLDRGARVVLLSHLGRPIGRVDGALTLRPVAEAVAARLGRPVRFAEDCIGPAAAALVADLRAGEIALLENLRFHAGEEANDPSFALELAALGELYVNDAFSTAHRAHASTVALAHLLPAAAGRAMAAELDALRAALETPHRPIAAVIGGAKVSTKLAVLGHLIDRVDALVIGGAMANTFLLAAGVRIGRSLCEPKLVGQAEAIRNRAAGVGCEILLPVDAVVAPALQSGVATDTVAIDGVADQAMILDVGPRTVADLKRHLENWRTLLWNGPLGAFETAPFDAATMALARAAADRTRAGALVSIAGGGDTVAALNRAGVTAEFSYVSTAGGAFLEWLEGKKLPGIQALESEANRA